MISKERQIKDYDKVGNLPESWIIAADDLLAAADILKEKHRNYIKEEMPKLKAGNPI